MDEFLSDSTTVVEPPWGPETYKFLGRYVAIYEGHYDRFFRVPAWILAIWLQDQNHGKFVRAVELALESSARQQALTTSLLLRKVVGWSRNGACHDKMADFTIHGQVNVYPHLTNDYGSMYAWAVGAYLLGTPMYEVAKRHYSWTRRQKAVLAYCATFGGAHSIVASRCNFEVYTRTCRLMREIRKH